MKFYSHTQMIILNNEKLYTDMFITAILIIGEIQEVPKFPIRGLIIPQLFLDRILMQLIKNTIKKKHLITQRIDFIMFKKIQMCIWGYNYIYRVGNNLYIDKETGKGYTNVATVAAFWQQSWLSFNIDSIMNFLEEKNSGH